jgi:phthiocerol/phenolphthiocerol synthesis type-I polyketide synthase D
VSASSPDFLKDHRIQGKVLLPASAYAEMFLAAAAGPIRDLSIREPLLLSESRNTTLQTVITGQSLQIFSLSANRESWKLHATASLSTEAAAPPSAVFAADFDSRMRGEMSGKKVYEATAAIGLEYGPAFQGLRRLRWNDTEAVGDIEMTAASNPYTLHPALFDSCLQVLGARLLANPGSDLFLPSKIGSLKVMAKPDACVTCRVSYSANALPGTWEADMQVVNPDGRVAIEARAIVCRQVSRPLPQAPAPSDLRYITEWREKESSFADEQGEPA